MKKTIRIIISIIMVGPTTLIIWVLKSRFGLLLFLYLFRFACYPFFRLGNNDERMKDSLGAGDSALIILISPWLFWYEWATEGTISLFD